MRHFSSFSATFSELPRLRKWIHYLCIHYKVEALSGQLQLCLHELFCNIVEHAYQNSNHCSIVMQAYCAKDRLLFDCYDVGGALPPNSEYKVNYGLLLIKKLSDVLIYKRKNQYNHWHIEKKI